MFVFARCVDGGLEIPLTNLKNALKSLHFRGYGYESLIPGYPEAKTDDPQDDFTTVVKDAGGDTYPCMRSSGEWYMYVELPRDLSKSNYNWWSEFIAAVADYATEGDAVFWEDEEGRNYWRTTIIDGVAVDQIGRIVYE